MPLVVAYYNSVPIFTLKDTPFWGLNYTVSMYIYMEKSNAR